MNFQPLKLNAPPLLTRPLVNLLIVLTLIASTGLSVLPHSGISWDEEATLGVVDINYQLVTQRGDPQGHRQNHRQYYGTWFNVAAEVAFKGQQAISGAVDSESEEALLLAQLRHKHVLTFLISLVAYVAVAGIVGAIASWKFAWIGPLVLLLIPRFWGNSFFNPKDIPLAAMFTLGTWVGIYLIRHYASRRNQSIGANAITGYSLLYGLLVGLIAGTRIDSSVLVLYVILVDVGLQLGQGRSVWQVLKFCQFYGLLLGTAVLSMLALYPGAWASSLSWYFAAFNFYYKEDWPHTVLFRGVDVPADSLPWDYLPTWIGMTTPAAILLLFALGLLWATAKYSRLSVGQRAGLLLVGLQVFGLPLFAMLYRATLFDTLRQVLYVLPGIAAIASLSIIWLYQLLRLKAAKLALISGLVALALPIFLDMAALHPYEYVYFNRASGGLLAAEGRFDTDYWGLSMADSVRWVNRQTELESTLISSEPTISADLFATETLTVIAYNDLEDEQIAGLSGEGTAPDGEDTVYYLSLPRWGFERRLADCPVVYATIRQQVPLARVRKCG